MKKIRFSLLNRLKTKGPDYQLALVASSDKKSPCLGPANLSVLPVEIIENILEQLVADREVWDFIRDLFSLSATCRYLNSILADEILYDKVVIRNKRQAKSFYKCICSSKSYKKKTPSLTKPSLLVKHIVFVHPYKDFQPDMGHMGHMMSTSSTPIEKSWAELILEIISKLPNLEHIELREISPNFEFPAFLMNIFPAKVLPQRLISLYMSSEEGWRVGITESQIWPFANFQKLYLHSMTLIGLNQLKESTPPYSARSSPPTSPFSFPGLSSSPNNASIESSYFSSQSPASTSHSIFLSRCKVHQGSKRFMFDRYATSLSIDAQSLQTCDLSTMFPHLEALNIGCIDMLPLSDQTLSHLYTLNSGSPPSQFCRKQFSQSGKASTFGNIEYLLQTIASSTSLQNLRSLSIFLSYKLLPNLLVALGERVVNNEALISCTIVLTTKTSLLASEELSRLTNVIESSSSLRNLIENFTIKDVAGVSLIN
ncbi:hypothetical protein AWJ20_628 [Sugiyamaella lignohabitans]|uniref:F-box domain-containing protein n=1 Tax=Sugiyamaella lignohabitans TaxID=796027 RepID=A0A161HIL5_9ASCO|nr:uncharacterized protein AWJ20_628 [Sugiyamaella lignohabitans]ANB12377.1 hypothetical protein AWJ20_628 [Sugiyamaella lignohabitans]